MAVITQVFVLVVLGMLIYALLNYALQFIDLDLGSNGAFPVVVLCIVVLLVLVFGTKGLNALFG